MICHQIKLLHIDICKNAGTSIIGSYNRSSSIIASHKKIGSIKFEGKHHSVKNFTPEISSVITEEILDEYIVASVIRNPYDRMVSLWKWGHRGNGIYKMDFNLFIQKMCDGTLKLHNDHHSKSQIDWISDNDGKIRVNHIIRYEKGIQEEMDRFHREVGLPSIKIIHTNQGGMYTKKHYSEFYNNESVELISDFFKDDLEYFGYSFEDFRK